MKSYNDGVISVYNSNISLNGFSAKVNERSINDLEFVTSLFFSEESKRQQDVIFAKSIDKQLTFKVKTPFSDKVEVNQKVIYKDKLYNIFFVDLSYDKQELFIYMEEVRKIGI